VDELKVAILLPTAGECLTSLHKALLGCFSQKLWTAPVGAGPREQIRILVRMHVIWRVTYSYYTQFNVCKVQCILAVHFHGYGVCALAR
jgi:hypothetical protein